jgi:2,4-dienoyl-CoA reductase-like NADH-dependent reductase (Old Yellow Enzyme family)
MSALFSPFKIGPLALSNRIVVAPMCQYSSVNGETSDWHTIHLGQLAESGAGLLIIEATAVAPEGRITYGDLGLWCDKTEQALYKTIQAIKRYSAMPLAIQLAHAGRKASCELPWLGGHSLASGDNSWQTLAPSAVPFSSNDAIPQAMSVAQIKTVVQAFASSAKRSEDIGFDAIELHAAHGYLLHQFLSPIANVRTDEYGGSLENRMRLVLEVFAAIKAAVKPTTPVGIRISGTDWLEGGWDIEQSAVLAKALEKMDCAYIHVSSGGLSPDQQIPVGPNYQVPLAEHIKAEVQIPVIAVGLITEPEQAEAIINEGQADLVGLARAMLYNPRWPWHAAAKLGGQVEAPPQYWRCQPRGLNDLFK